MQKESKSSPATQVPNKEEESSKGKYITSCTQPHYHASRAFNLPRLFPVIGLILTIDVEKRG